MLLILTPPPTVMVFSSRNFVKTESEKSVCSLRLGTVKFKGSHCCACFNFTGAKVQNFIMFLIITNSIVLGVQAGKIPKMSPSKRFDLDDVNFKKARELFFQVL